MMFRGSSAGKCTRELVLKQTRPELFTVPDDKRLFLDAGHYLQDAVEGFLRGALPATPYELLSEWRESEGESELNGWRVTGHVDGVLRVYSDTGVTTHLLEVKAIQAKSFNKLKKAGHWKDQYAHYTYQAQTYLHFNALQEPGGSTLSGPFDGTFFIFYNRDTSEMLGGIPFEYPGYTFRGDMYEPRREDLWQQVIYKFDKAAAHLEAGTEPEGCDAEGYCFFCRQQGKGFQLKKEKRVGLQGDDPENLEIVGLLADIRDRKEEIGIYFKEFKADVIVLDDGVELKRDDYV